MKLTQRDLNGTDLNVVSLGMIQVWAKQTGTKGLYEVTIMNGYAVTSVKYLKGIESVRRLVDRFNRLA